MGKGKRWVSFPMPSFICIGTKIRAFLLFYFMAEELSKLNDFFAAATTSNHQFERTSIRYACIIYRQKKRDVFFVCFGYGNRWIDEINNLIFRTYYSNVDISSSSVSSVKSNTMPRRAVYYQEPYKENNNGKDIRLGSCRDYPIDPAYENGGLGPLRAPMLPPISRSCRWAHNRIKLKTAMKINNSRAHLCCISDKSNRPHRSNQFIKISLCIRTPTKRRPVT